MKYLSVILFLLSSFSIFSQNNLYEIEYVYVANNDETVQSFDKLYYDSLKKKAFYKQGNTKVIANFYQPKNEYEIVIPSDGKNTDFIYVDFNKNILYNQISPLHNTYITTEPIPIINWKITEETKSINEIELTKATTTFRGRNYEVWFSYEHPISIGPWKFNGLPGLIFEVIELAETNNYSWKLKSLKTKKGILPFNNPLDRNLIDIKNFINKYQEDFIDDENILLSKMELNFPNRKKEEIIKDFEKFRLKDIEKKYEWEE
ncbi:GLPGLI family protein [Paenimyroides tangerinum]|uniref:GLPGLI family protein n=1 Tax=Paenimyroides tangerinum TaxID=2488728 RepID=A0A3P3W903_9FLAO|nr:GLPGLI family protein [Paenimyroides tangerinum]RRJ91642.1 GLPGLI family protein [Paenimyroides tangerinum]